jgi:hypothetical protein
MEKGLRHLRKGSRHACRPIARCLPPGRDAVPGCRADLADWRRSWLPLPVWHLRAALPQRRSAARKRPHLADRRGASGLSAAGLRAASHVCGASAASGLCSVSSRAGSSLRSLSPGPRVRALPPCAGLCAVQPLPHAVPHGVSIRMPDVRPLCGDGPLPRRHGIERLFERLWCARGRGHVPIHRWIRAGERLAPRVVLGSANHLPARTDL